MGEGNTSTHAFAFVSCLAYSQTHYVSAHCSRVYVSLLVTVFLSFHCYTDDDHYGKLHELHHDWIEILEPNRLIGIYVERIDCAVNENR